MSVGAWVLIAVAVGVLAFGGWRAARDGRFRGTHAVRGADEGTAQTTPAPAADSVLAGTEWAESLGERATLLQFSSAFCAPCRATRVLLAEVSEKTEGVAHIEIDAEHHLDLVRRLGITRTPTTLVLDPTGRELTRAMGAPRREHVLAAISGV